MEVGDLGVGMSVKEGDGVWLDWIGLDWLCLRVLEARQVLVVRSAILSASFAACLPAFYSFTFFDLHFLILLFSCTLWYSTRP